MLPVRARAPLRVLVQVRQLSNRPSRVSALPFRLGTEDAVYRARLAALEQLLPTIKGRFGGLAFAVSQAMGLSFLTDSEENVMRFVSSRAIYYPTWVVDGMFRAKVRGDQGEAMLHLISTASAFPGNSWRPMDTVPLRAPPPRLHNTPPAQPRVITEPDEPMEYAPFSRDRHLNPDLAIDGGITVLPFNLSPLGLPELFSGADLRTLILDLLADGPALHINRRFQILPGVEIQVADVNESSGDSQAIVRLDRDSLELDVFACYPVMLPLHLVHFAYDAHGERDRRATVALGAWQGNLLAYALRSEERDAWMCKQEPSWLDVDLIDFYPRVPVSTSSIDPFAGKELAAYSDSRIIDLMAQQSQMQGLFESRATKLIENADWAVLEAWQRTHAASESTPEAEAGLGTHIDWNSKHVRPLYDGVEQNRQYIALSSEALFSKRLLEGIVTDRRNGGDISRVQTFRDGDLVTGMYDTGATDA